MELCPPEICAEIFQLACVDDGTTGRSLSLVSRYIHNASSSVKYQSLAVRGPHQTLALASVLETTSPSQRRVHDLSISIDLRYSSAQQISSTEKVQSSMSSLTKLVYVLRSLVPGQGGPHSWHQEMADEIRREAEAQFYESARRLEEQAADAFLRILDLVSPNLHTLAVSFRDMEFPTSFSNLTFPRLHELMIAYGGGRQPTSDCMLSSLQPLPSL